MAYGVPNPYVATTHPWPTRFRGGIWTRPTFGMPYMRSVQSVFKPSDFNDGNPALRGLGDTNAANGVFGTSQGGGGVFGPSLYGLGSDDKADLDAIYENVSGMLRTAPTQARAAIQSFQDWYNGIKNDLWISGSQVAEAKQRQAEIIDMITESRATTTAKASAYTPPPTYALPSTTTNTGGSTPAASSGGLRGQAAGQTGDSRVRELQIYLNRVLATAGLSVIDQDGKLGPKGCGAIAWYRGPGRSLASADTAAAIDANLAALGGIYSVVCAKKGATAPGGSGGTVVKAPPVYVAPLVVDSAPPPSTQAEPAKASMMGAGTWAMIGGGVLAVGLAVVGKKKGWF